MSVQKGAGLPDWLLAAVPLLFISAPVALCHLRRVDSWSYRLSIPAFSDRAAWSEALCLNARTLALIIPPWLLGYHLYQTRLFGHHLGDGWRHGLAPALLAVGQPPPRYLQELAQALTGSHAQEIAVLAGVQVFTLVAFQIFFVAVPEEFFYRGYFLTRLNEVLPRRFLVLGTPMGWGAVIACTYFAFGHSVVQWQWWHFATFFPGMIFAWMRERTGGIAAGALFHAACNIMVVLLDSCYGVPRAM